MTTEISFWNEEDEVCNVGLTGRKRSLTMLDRDDHPDYYWAWSEDDNPDFDPRTGTHPIKYRVFRITNTTKGIPLTEPMSRAEAIAKCEQIIKLTRED
jgi:hypothetical protein